MLDEKGIRFLREVFSSYSYIMTTAQLDTERLFYRGIQRIFKAGVIEKVERGYYHWAEGYGDSEVTLIDCLFPGVVLCVEAVLFHYDYSDRSPAEWNITTDKNVSRNRTSINYPFIKAYHVKPSLITLGETRGQVDLVDVRTYDHDRTIYGVLRNMNRVDREIFDRTIQDYVKDPKKNVPNLMEYAEVLRVQKKVGELIEVWL